MFVINKEVKWVDLLRVETLKKLYWIWDLWIKEEDYLQNNYQEWLEIANDPTTHIGENLKVNFLTSPAEYAGKGTYGLVDGAKGYKIST
jgi:hypothetical protein